MRPLKAHCSETDGSDSYPLSAAEHVTAVKNINLEVSENTHERRDMIAVGTAIARGEDIPARGCIYVFEVIKVVPDPEKAESDRKLKLIGKEPVKGAITALSGIGGQGFLIAAQGQKCMVRGLKEDGSLLPVAFMDMQCYVNVVKELRGTGMCILSDAIKGTWFAGYSVLFPLCVYMGCPNDLTRSTGGALQDESLWKRPRLSRNSRSRLSPRRQPTIHPGC